MIEKLKAEHREKEINETVKVMKKWNKMQAPVSKDLAYVEGDLFRAYIHDMKIVQRFAVLNRKAMAEAILKELCAAYGGRFQNGYNPFTMLIDAPISIFKDYDRYWYEYEDTIKVGEDGRTYRGSQLYVIEKESGKRIAKFH